MLLLKQNITRKEQVDEKVTELKFEADSSKKYKVKVIWNSIIYVNKTKGYLLVLYYLEAWKRYFDQKNT